MTTPQQQPDQPSTWDKLQQEDRWRIEALLTQSDNSIATDPPPTRWNPPHTHPAARPPAPQPLLAASESSRMRQQVKSLFRQFQEDSCQDQLPPTSPEWRNAMPPGSPHGYGGSEAEPFFTDLFSSPFTPNTSQLEQALTPVLHASISAALTPNVVETSGTSLLGAPSSIWSPQSSNSRHGSPYDAPKIVARSPRANTPTSVDARSPARSKKAPAKGWWKTEICKFWREGGGCRNEANCRWAHGLHELRRLETPETIPNDLSPAPAEEACWTGGGETRETRSPRLSSAYSTPPQEDENQLASQMTTNWILCPLSSVSPESRPAAVQSVWERIRSQNLQHLLQEENVFIAGPPGLQVHTQYWKKILNILSKPINQNVCDLCTSTASPVTLMSLSSSTSGLPESFYLKCCDDCKVILEEKCSILNWNSIIMPPNNTASNDNTRSHQWGLRFASLLRTIDDGMWTNGKSYIDVFDVNPVVDRWAQHEMLVARACLLVKTLMEKLTSSRRMRLSTMEVVPGLSLVEWMAIGEQPMLFVGLLLASFPLHKTSLPTKLTHLGVPLRSTTKQQQRMIITSMASKSAASPSALSTGINSPASSEEVLANPSFPSGLDNEQYLDGNPITSITTTGDSGPITTKAETHRHTSSSQSDASQQQNSQS